MPTVRVLDLDLDFFLHGAAHWVSPDGGERLDAEEYPPWELADALDYLERQCLLTQKLPGVAVEHHSEIFWLWGEAIAREAMSAPFSVTHLDAHADLGLGDAGYAYLMNELAFEAVVERYAILEDRRPATRNGIHLLGSKDLTMATGWRSPLFAAG